MSTTTTPTLETELTRIDSQRSANRDDLGRITNQALDRRLCAEERRLVISALGWAAEQPDGDPYAATTGEMLRWIREDAQKVAKTPVFVSLGGAVYAAEEGR